MQRRPRWRGPRVSALAALAAGAIVAIAVAGTLGNSGGHPASSPARAAQLPTTTAPPIKHHPPPHKPAATTTTHSTATVTATPAAATTPPPLADTLEARGHQLMDEGDYAAAIPVLRQALSAASPSDVTYAYALFDLGRSLRLAGDPKDAARVLYQRLQIPNQTSAVRQELQLALLTLGQQAKKSGGAAPKSPGPGPHHHPKHPHGPLAAPGGAPAGGPQGNQGD